MFKFVIVAAILKICARDSGHITAIASYKTLMAARCTFVGKKSHCSQHN